ncbi:MAG: hypothetical protein AB1486_01735 [Planctomycetota bacterium]
MTPVLPVNVLPPPEAPAVLPRRPEPESAATAVGERTLLWKMGGPAIVLGLAAVAQLGLWIAVGRALPKADVGVWVLAQSLVVTLSAIGLLGTANAWAAYFSRPGAERQDWRVSLRHRAVWGLPLTLAAAVLAFLWFRLPWLLSGLLLVAVLGFETKELFSTGLLRARRHYVMSALQQKLWIFLLAALLGGAWWLAGATLGAAIWALVIALGLNAWLALRSAWRRVPPGCAPPARTVDRIALGFWVVTLSLIVTRHVDRLMLLSFAGREPAATYAMMMAILGAYELSTAATGHVLLPYCNALVEVRLGRLLALVGGLAAGLAVLYLGAADWIVGTLLRGKYADGVPLIPLLVAVESVRLLGVVPGSLIGARLGSYSLKLFSRANVGLALLTVGLLAWWVPLYGTWGSAAALLVCECLRTAIGFALVFRFRRHLRPRGAPMTSDI